MEKPMAQDNIEQEAKFYIANLPGLRARLEQAGAELLHPRVFESNLRFDLPDGSLTRKGQVLRLRQDERVRLTYKGPAEFGHEVAARAEIEFEASSFANARALLEALGYTVSVMYEKYRATYALGGCEVTLDEMPYGDFAEIEGPDVPAIQAVAVKLKLSWAARCTDSYLMLFSRLRLAGLVDAPHLTFGEVKRKFPAEAFGLAAADLVNARRTGANRAK
jgi:adenylate cyclase class 2